MVRIEAQQKVGEPLNTDAIDRALWIVGDLPGVSVTGNLREGTQEGETELVLLLVNKPLVTGEADLDNTGARSTGENRVSVTASLNSPLGIGDQATLNAIHTDGSDYAQLGYSLPVGVRGARANVTLSRLDYRLIGSDFSALNGSGNSNSAGLDLSYPLVREREQNLSIGLGLQNKSFHNDAAGVVQSDYSDILSTVSLTGNRFDALGGGGANTLELSYAQGNINQGTLDAGENAAFGGTFSKLHYALSRQQTLTDSLSLYGALSGQTASKDLDTSERMYLGGATGVRAYPANEGGGSEGQLLNVELRQRLAGNFMLSGFYDWGHVNNGASVGPSYDLKGYGLGLGWISDAGASVKLVYSRRDGSNPNPSTSGNDQDGSLVRDRFWLSLTIPFGSSAESAPVASAAPAYGASVLAAPAPAPTPTPTPTAVAVPAGASDATPVLAATAPMPALAPAAPAAAVPVDSAPPAVATAEASSKDQSAAPTATELQAQMQAIQQTLSAWMQAWQRADVPAYLAFYDAGFQPAKGLSLAQWQAQRRQRLTHAGTIQISASAAHVVLKRESALVEFEQAYQSAHYHDKVHKVLQLRRSGAQWRIVSESASKD